MTANNHSVLEGVVRAVGAKREITPTYFVLEGIETRVREAVKRMDIVQYVPEVAEQFASWAERAVELAHGHELEPETVTGERMLRALEDREAACQQAAVRLAATEEAFAEASQAFAGVPTGLTRCRHIIAAVGLCTVGVVIMLGIAGLLAPALDHYVLGSYLERLGGRAWSLQVSLLLATMHALALVFGGIFAVLWTKGRLGWWTKLLLVLGELAYSCAFAAIRLDGSGFTAQSLAWTLFEASLLLVNVSVLLAVKSRLAVLIKERRTWRTLRAQLEHKQRAVAEAKKALEEKKRAEAAQAEVVQEREESVVELKRKLALARQTAHLVYLVELFALRAAGAREGGVHP